jgi:predicted oxidoreductase (fatty acid repression mutant protein)
MLNSLHSRIVCVVKADAEKFWEKVRKDDKEKKNFE